jgi:hypothetical protein
MTLAVPAVDALDATYVSQVQALLAQYLAENFPDVESRAGVVHDLVLGLAGTLFAAVDQQIALLQRSQSLLAISQDPAAASDDAVDAVLSNFRVARGPGAAASGAATLVVTQKAPLIIPSGPVFSANGVTLATSAAYAVRADAATVLGPGDLVLAPIGSGQYAVTVPVTATAPGVAGMLKRGTALVPSFAVPYLQAAYVEGDFTGGVDAESNADLLARLNEGLAAKAWSNRVNISALIRSQPAFARCLQVSIIGAGDAELTRAAHSLFPIMLPGRSDVYPRTAQLPASLTLQVEATLVRKAAGGGVWQFDLGRDDAPGFYQVDRVALPTTPQTDAGFAIVADVRGMDLTGRDWTPDLVDPSEAAYTPFQTATVQFLDPVTRVDGLAIGAKAAYAASVRLMPQLAELQEFLGSRAVRDPGGDVLVRAPVPCFVTLSFSVLLRPGAVFDEALGPRIAAALAARVNGAGFAGRLYASSLVPVISSFLPSGAEVGAIDMLGRIRRPDGTHAVLRDPRGVVLEVPDEPGRLVTPRTTVFVLDPLDVSVGSRAIAVPIA